MTFQDLHIPAPILKAIADLGYKKPTDIQMQAVPPLMQKKDLCASSMTGSGKTAAFLLPALTHLLKPSKKQGHSARVLILVPTRELVLQVAEEAQKYSKYLSKIKTVCIYGGVPYPKQKQQLSRAHEILVATPGRLIDLIKQKKVSFQRIELLVLDEADRMMDMGFIEPVKYIASLTPKDRQTVLFSATLDKKILRVADELLNDPQMIKATPDQIKPKKIEQQLYHVSNIRHKQVLLEHLLKEKELEKAIIFTATKRCANDIADRLNESGYRAALLHGDIKQSRRTKTVTDFKKNRISTLVVTDVASRGIDIQTITHVVNFDLPMNVEDYIHRIGRTGRADSSGCAISFVAPKEMYLVRQIENYLQQKMLVKANEDLDLAFKVEKSFKKKDKNKSDFSKRFRKQKFKKRSFSKRK